jgi:hypothetical protein
VQQIQEKAVTSSAPSGTVAFDWSTGDIFYITSVGGNFTANITNLPTTAARAYSIVFILQQTGTPGIINALQINGTGVTIRWLGGSAPTATASRIETISFALYYDGPTSTWYPLGQLASFA